MTEPRPNRPKPAAQAAPDANKGGSARRLLVDLSVVALSALTLGGSFLVIAEVDRAHAQPELALASTATTATTATTASTAAGAPAPGLVAAPRPQRREVVVRRSRAS